VQRWQISRGGPLAVRDDRRPITRHRHRQGPACGKADRRARLCRESCCLGCSASRSSRSSGPGLGHESDGRAGTLNPATALAVRLPWVRQHLATVGNVDEKLLGQARQAQQRLIRAEHEAEVAWAEFHRAVHRLVLHGSPPRDVAAALGLSDQQLHQIVQQAGGSGRGGRESTPDTDLACTFCGRSQHEVRKLIAGPGAYICDACVGLAEGAVSPGSATETRLGQVRAVPEQDGRVCCRFCGKRRGQVTGLAAMPGDTGGEPSGPATICTECLSMCNEILADELT
jgi:hypothetical protein